MIGAPGALGTTLVPEVAAAGYAITGLGRSERSVRKVKLLARGIKAIKGDITDPDICTKAAAEASIVIHVTFDHGQAFSGDFHGACGNWTKPLSKLFAMDCLRVRTQAKRL